VGKPSLNAAQPYAKAEGRVFLLVPAYPGCPGTKAVKLCCCCCCCYVAHLRHVLYTLLSALRKKHSVIENPKKSRLTTLIQNIVTFTKLGARVDSEIPQGTKRYKYFFFKKI